MSTYTFIGPSGKATTVVATSEREARHLAMLARWGAASPLTLPEPGTTPKRYTTIGRDGYCGLGLELFAKD